MNIIHYCKTHKLNSIEYEVSNCNSNQIKPRKCTNVSPPKPMLVICVGDIHNFMTNLKHNIEQFEFEITSIISLETMTTEASTLATSSISSLPYPFGTYGRSMCSFATTMT